MLEWIKRSMGWKIQGEGEGVKDALNKCTPTVESAWLSVQFVLGVFRVNFIRGCSIFIVSGDKQEVMLRTARRIGGTFVGNSTLSSMKLFVVMITVSFTVQLAESYLMKPSHEKTIQPSQVIQMVYMIFGLAVMIGFCTWERGLWVRRGMVDNEQYRIDVILISAGLTIFFIFSAVFGIFYLLAAFSCFNVFNVAPGRPSVRTWTTSSSLFFASCISVSRPCSASSSGTLGSTTTDSFGTPSCSSKRPTWLSGSTFWSSIPPTGSTNLFSGWSITSAYTGSTIEAMTSSVPTATRLSTTSSSTTSLLTSTSSHTSSHCWSARGWCFGTYNAVPRRTNPRITMTSLPTCFCVRRRTRKETTDMRTIHCWAWNRLHDRVCSTPWCRSCASWSASCSTWPTACSLYCWVPYRRSTSTRTRSSYTATSTRRWCRPRSSWESTNLGP